MSSSNIALFSLLQLEEALLAKQAKPADVIAVLEARLARPNVPDHKRKRTEAFLARVKAGKLAKGSAQGIFDALKAEGEEKGKAARAAKAQAATPAKAEPPKAEAKAAKAKAQPKAQVRVEPTEPKADPMSLLAASMAEIARQTAQTNNTLMAFLAKFEAPKARGKRA